jgi:hypothetical protein
MRLSPADEELAKDDIAEKLGVARGDIKHIAVVDWITGEVLVSFHGPRKLASSFLEPAIQ